VNRLPPYIRAGIVGEACGMTTRQAKAMLQRAGIGELMGGCWVVGESRLRERLPEVYDRVFEHVCLHTETDANQPEPT